MNAPNPLKVPSSVLTFCERNAPLKGNSIRATDNVYEPINPANEELSKLTETWLETCSHDDGESRWESVCFKRDHAEDYGPFIKVIFRNRHAEISAISPDNNNTHKNFLDHYEHYQRDHRTTLNQALLNSSLVNNNRLTIFHAECLAPGDGKFLEFSSVSPTVTKQGAGSVSEGVALLSLRIGIALQAFLLSEHTRKCTVFSSGNRPASVDDRKEKEDFSDKLGRCLDHAYAALRTPEGADYSRSVTSFARLLLYPTAPETADRILLREGLRLIQGILVNLHYAKACSGKKKTLVIIILRSEKDDLELHDALTFMSFFNNAEGCATMSQEMLGYTYWLHAIHYHSLPPENADGKFDEKTFQLACASAHGSKIADKLGPTRDEKAFKGAVAAAIKFATFYRPASVHEGREQQLSLIVGFADEVKRLYLRVVKLRPAENSAHAHEGLESFLELNIPAVRKPVRGSERRDRFIEAQLIQARSKIKAYSNLLDRPDYAILIEAKLQTNNIHDSDGTQIDYHYYRCLGIYAIGRDVENYKYPFAQNFYAVDRESNMALVKVHGRTRVDLVYKGEPKASWTDQSAMWRLDPGWTEATLADAIAAKVCKCKDCGAGVVNKEDNRDCKRRLDRLVAVVFEIARSPMDGAAIVICNDEDFDLCKPNKCMESLQKLRGRIQNMGDGDFDKLNHLLHMEETDGRDDSILKRLLTLDGGSVANLATGCYWARRRFIGPPEFNLQYKYKGAPATLKDYWDTVGRGGAKRWSEWPIFREWGTRHQYSLALSATELIQNIMDSKGTPKIRLNPKAKPDYVVLVASADGNITLMYNGSVISPD